MRTVLVVLLLLLGCGSSGRRKHHPPPEPWTLKADGLDWHGIAAVVSRVVVSFHKNQHPVTRRIRFVATPGWRFCGTIWTVGCNPELGLIEFDPDWTAYVVAHDLFHDFSAELSNPHPGRDPFHQDVRWPQWDNWIGAQH